MSFKHLFSRSLSAAPGRLHVAAHSHHLWPDASFDGQVACWEDGARLADRKWDRIMGEVWTEAQRRVAAEIGTGRPDAVVFAANTHDWLIRLCTAAPRRAAGPLRILTTDGEFHSARRQFARWEETGEVVVTSVPAEPLHTLADRLVERARKGEHDLILVSQVLFGSGAVLDIAEELAGLTDPGGPWAVLDGYHSFMALERPLAGVGDALFYLAGGYKYAMAGEGMGLMHCPPGFGPRPPITGWYAEFAALSSPPGEVGYATDGMRFMGATFDASALYRFTAIQTMLEREGLDTASISTHVRLLQERLVAGLAATPLGDSDLLNPLGPSRHARFLAFRSPSASEWNRRLAERDCITDVRGDVLRIGFGLYNDAEDVDRLLGLLGDLA